MWWLTGDGEGHWLGHQIVLHSPACELCVCVFFLGRILENRGSCWQSGDGVDQHRGLDGSPYAGNERNKKQNKTKNTLKTRQEKSQGNSDQLTLKKTYHPHQPPEACCSLATWYLQVDLLLLQHMLQAAEQKQSLTHISHLWTKSVL